MSLLSFICLSTKVFLCLSLYLSIGSVVIDDRYRCRYVWPVYMHSVSALRLGSRLFRMSVCMRYGSTHHLTIIRLPMYTSIDIYRHTHHLLYRVYMYIYLYSYGEQDGGDLSACLSRPLCGYLHGFYTCSAVV